MVSAQGRGEYESSGVFSGGGMMMLPLFPCALELYTYSCQGLMSFGHQSIHRSSACPAFEIRIAHIDVVGNAKPVPFVIRFALRIALAAVLGARELSSIEHSRPYHRMLPRSIPSCLVCLPIWQVFGQIWGMRSRMSEQSYSPSSPHQTSRRSRMTLRIRWPTSVLEITLYFMQQFFGPRRCISYDSMRSTRIT